MLIFTDRSALLDRIRKEYPQLEQVQHEYLASRTIEETDARLEQNVQEWIRGEELSDIWIGAFCIGMVMSIRGGRDFLWALEDLSAYARDPVAGETRIWRVKR